jgi:hypothetical protein
MRLIALFVCLSAWASAQSPIATYAPLTPGQRWYHYLHQTVLSPGIYLASFAAAGGSQLAKDPPEWGQGIDGYSKRTATLFATFSIQATVQEGAAAALGYDPRHLRCECQGAGRRLAHGLLWSFLTKNDEGQTRFNVPVVAGAYAAGMIPMLWYPERYSPLRDGFRRGSQQLGFSVGANLMAEFSPEIKRFFRRKSIP